MADGHEDWRRLTGAARWLWVLALAAWLLAPPAGAEQWSRAYIRALPDSAFAVVETTPDGKKVRHLPHHDQSGRVDPAHVRNALSRLSQVKWVDPRHAATARQHLLRHLREMRSAPTAAPVPKKDTR